MECWIWKWLYLRFWQLLLNCPSKKEKATIKIYENNYFFQNWILLNISFFSVLMLLYMSKSEQLAKGLFLFCSFWNCLFDFIIFPWVVHLLLLISENSLYKINYHMFFKSFPSLLFVFCLWHFQLCEVFNLYV